TMSPYQHGEVFVTTDGAETDLDLGHYERFTGINTSRDCNYTAGRIYDSIIKKERRGDFLGGTVQVVPHVTSEICEAIRSVSGPDVDVIISEIGGTVGDIESLPFLEALRQFRLAVGRSDTLFIHVTLIPYLHKAGEVKTKPTQHSVGRLREIGIIPDILICRTERHLDKEVRRKLSLFCNVSEDAVVEAFDVENTIYEVPLALAEQNLDHTVIDELGIRAGRRNLRPWREYVDNVVNAKGDVTIGVVGKYSELLDAYKSIHESLNHAAAYHTVNMNIVSLAAEDIEQKGAAEILKDIDGILVPGGFGSRGLEGKIQAVQYARERKVPFLGICLGMHMAVIEFARNILGLEGADSTEDNPDTPHPVIHLMEEQKKVMNMGATMRLGAYPCVLKKGTVARKSYGKERISERHRHRYEFNNEYREQFEKAGMTIAGQSPDGMLVEMVELSDHPWFVAGQFHPEFKSRPVEPHPLFRDFVGASVNTKNAASKQDD
ncbi:MAG: CTP synthase, partial [Chitinivibrionales bacterium]|nr:CTP synthase [Chitinivibrionales bacterium]